MKKLLFSTGIVLTVFAIGLAAVLFVAGPVQAVSGSSYEHLKLFNEVLALVESKYVEEVDTKDLIYGAIEGMLRKLDPHSAFLTPDFFEEFNVDTKGSFGGLGIEISIKDDYIAVISPIDDTPAMREGLLPGDLIVAIEGESTKGMSLFDAVHLLRGPKGTAVTITILREGESRPFEVTITRAIIKIQSVKSRVLEDGLGYAKVTTFNMTTTRDLKKAMRELQAESAGIKGLVLDLRNNPGGLLSQAVKVSDLFLEEGKIVYTSGRDRNQNMVERATMAGTYSGFPIVVLINGGSASASEIVSGALQDHKRAVLVGTKTYGKGSVQTIMRMDDGSGLKLTTAKYFTPNGRDIQAKGIEPDIVVEASPYASMDAAKRKFYLGRLRESDLKNRLLNKDEEGKEGEASPEAVPEMTDEEEEAVLTQDYQLDLAIELLKSWGVFQNVKVTGS